MRFRALLLPLLIAGCTATTQRAAPGIGLYSVTFGTPHSVIRTLIVVLHGEGVPGHYGFAAKTPDMVPDSVAVALLRPGYIDGAHNRSPGLVGNETGDNLTADRIAAVGDAVASLRARYPRANVVLVGEGGGAALAANLAGIRPGLIDGIVLVGCPCALPEWRRLMRWEGAVQSLDPLQTAGGLSPSLRAAVLVGADDTETPVKFSRAYAEALTLRGIATDYRIVPGSGNERLNDPEVLAATQRLAASLPRKN